MHIVRASERYRGNKTAETSEVSAAFKVMAKELNCPVIALAQLSRQVETRDSKRPILADLRESGGLEQDADMVIFAYREHYYKEQQRPADPSDEMMWLARLAEIKNKLELIVAKNRHGPTGTVEMFCDIASNYFCDSQHGGRS